MNQELQDYIKKSREAGFSEEQIKQELLKVGWKEQDINQEFNGGSAPNPVPMPASTLKKKGIIYYYLAVLKKYVVFKGRAQRKEYWSFSLMNIVVGIILGIISGIIHDTRVILGTLYALAIMIPGIAVTVRRFHDINLSGRWCFIVLIPGFGAVALLIFMLRDSQPGTNKYGPNPKEIAS